MLAGCCFPRRLVDNPENYVYKAVELGINERGGTIKHREYTFPDNNSDRKAHKNIRNIGPTTHLRGLARRE